VIPIEDKVIDPVIRRRIDLFFHNERIGLVLMAPEWNLRLLVPGKARASLLNQMPLGPSRPVHFLVARINVVIREIVTPHSDVACGCG
jgi:hypothetical protein